MDKKLTKKMAARILVVFILVMGLIFLLLSKIDHHMQASSDASTEAATEENTGSSDTDTKNNTVALGGADDLSDESSSAASSNDGTMNLAGMSTEERNKTAALMASDIFIDTKQGAQSNDIGKLSIRFDSDYAYGASLSVSGITMDAVLYHDGDQNDLKGLVGNIPLFQNVSAPDSVDQCKKILEEYIPDGTGKTSEWEEADGYFIRKISGYDNDDSCSVVYYAIVPKKQGDPNVYTIVLSASKADDIITPLSEKSFHSMVDPVAELVPDSKLINTDYKSSVSELKDIAYYETAKEDETFSGLYQLRKAARNWTETVYGTDDPSTLTEEERKDKYWQYIDPEGYREAKYYEAQAKAAEARDKAEPAESDQENSETDGE